MNPQKQEAWSTLHRCGYNWALSDTEEACAILDHPELTEDDPENYHKWAEPYPRRCYCGSIGYTEKGRFYACRMDAQHLEILRKCFPDKEFHNRQHEPYLGVEL